MRRRLVVEGIATGFIHLIPRMKPVALVKHHVENHGYPVLMAYVDKLLIVSRSAISLVGRKIEIGIITPGDIAIEFHDREHFYCIHSKRFQIRDLLDGLTHGAVAVGLTLRAGEVAEEELINDKVRSIHAFEALHFPIVIVNITLINGQRHTVDHVERILRKIGEHVGEDIFVVPGIKHETRIRIAHLLLSVYEEIITILLGVVEAGDGGPEIAHTHDILIIHNLIIIESIIVPCAHNHHVLLLRSTEAERHASVSILHGTHLRSAAGIILSH